MATKMGTVETSCSIKVLMFPWLAHGHISPFLELGKQLSKRNFQIYLCSTPINLASIKQNLPNSSSIQLVELHLPSLPDLPPHCHTTNGLPPHLMPTLKKALHMARPAFSHILDTLCPDLLIFDFEQVWAPTEASLRNIPALQFISMGATMLSFGLHMVYNPDIPFPFPEIYLHEFEKIKLLQSMDQSSSNPNGDDGHVSDPKEMLLEGVKRSGGVLFKSCRELEAKYIDYFSTLLGNKALPVGPLVQDTTDEAEDGHDHIIEWLDKKERCSSVFVSFGSEYFLSKEEMTEIAHGLELSGVNFVWVVRFPVGERIEIVEALPNGYLERTRSRGLVVEGWAPQTRILKHRSVGGFVSHCGWSSFMESLKYGVPIIAMPMQIDQPLNARLVEEIGVGIEVKRDSTEWRVERNEIARVVKEVVVGVGGEGVRRKVREMSKKMEDKREEEIDGVVHEIVKLVRKRSL